MSRRDRGVSRWIRTPFFASAVIKRKISRRLISGSTFSLKDRLSIFLSIAWWRSARQHRWRSLLQHVEQQREQNRVMSFPSTSREMKLYGDTARWWSQFFFFYTPVFIALRYDDVPTWNAARRVLMRVRFCASVRISRARSKLSGQSHSIEFYAIMNVAVQMMGRKFFFFIRTIVLGVTCKRSNDRRSRDP